MRLPFKLEPTLLGASCKTADRTSRGTEVTTLVKSTLWWKGPQWLTQEPSCWPNLQPPNPTSDLEVCHVHIATEHHQEDLTLRFSTLSKLTE